MLRTILAVIAGFIVAVLTMLALEALGASLFPPPLAAPDSGPVFVASTSKLLWVLMGWTVAAFLGGWVASRISLRHRSAAAITTGLLVVVGVVINAAMLPHPLWMTIAGVLLPIPAAWLATRIGRTASPATPLS